MRPSDLMLDFGRPVAYYPGLVRHFGSVNAVIFFAQVFYWQDKAGPDGVYKTADEIQSETGLSYREQATARALLKSKGLLIETAKRLEHKTFYLIDLDVLDGMLGGVAREMRNRRSGNDKSAVRGTTNPQFVHTENTTESTTEILTGTDVPGDKAVIDVEGLFDRFWSKYPKKLKRKDALKAWLKIKLTDDLFEKIMTALGNQMVTHDWMKDEGQFIPYPASWLNAERWMDELSPTAGKTIARSARMSNLPQHSEADYQQGGKAW